MANTRVTTTLAIAAAITVTACNRPEPAQEPTRTESAADANLSERNEDAAELERRVAELERQWTEMQAEVKEENATPTAALRDEVREDVANVRDAVADLRTTSPDNWWERYERATGRTIEDVEEDVQRFAKTTTAPAPVVEPEPVGTTASFDDRRNAWIASARARVDAMEERLKDVKADGPQETELEDTRARIDKLQDDLDRLRTASPDEWWDVSAERVREYVDRVERSIGRLDDDDKS